MDATNAQTCRTCLAENAANLGLNCIMQNCPSSRTYKEILQELTQIQIMDELEFQMPQNICSSCYKQLQIAYNFIRKSQECNQKLLEMFSKHVQADDGMEKVEYVIVKQEDDEQFLMDMVQDIRNEPVQMSIVKEEKILENEQMEEASCSNINKVVEDYDENSKSLTENSSHMFSDNPCDDDDDEYIPDKDDEEYIPDKEFTKPNELDKRISSVTNVMDLENKNPINKQFQLNENFTSNPGNSRTCQNCQNWIGQLTESVNQFKGAIEELAATSVRQNTKIMESLATQRIMTQKLLGKEKIEANVKKIFPIQTVDDLAEINNKIRSTNNAAYTLCMSSLLKGQLHKSLTQIFSMDVIIASNIDGIHGKLPLKNFKSLFDALMDAIRANGEENPEKAFRNALKIVKKRHFQAICVSKKKVGKLNNGEQEATTTP